MITFNINDTVRVKLTDHGRRILEGQTHPKEDSEGWSEWQLWMLFQDFGGHVYWGCKAPFVDIQLVGRDAMSDNVT